MDNGTDACGFPLGNSSVESASAKHLRLCESLMDTTTAYSFIAMFPVGILGNGIAIVVLLARSYNKCQSGNDIKKTACGIPVNGWNGFVLTYLPLRVFYLCNRFFLLWTSHRLAAVVGCFSESLRLAQYRTVLIFIDGFLQDVCQGLLAAYALNRYLAVGHPALYLKWQKRSAPRRYFVAGFICFVLFIGSAGSVVLVRRFRSAFGATQHVIHIWSQLYSWIQSCHQLTCATTVTSCCIFTWRRLELRQQQFPRPSTAVLRVAPQPCRRAQNHVVSEIILIISTFFYWLGNGIDLAWSFAYIGSSSLCLWRYPYTLMLKCQPITDLLRHIDVASSFMIYGSTWIIPWLCPPKEPALENLELRNIVPTTMSTARIQPSSKLHDQDEPMG
ncbi:uncharacterized protein LOC129601659 [Paramacrobiotus metropolitanus]|uniref:uncharacterized protein LOC129601659 n=1 Tax=Paramacrobiotus metropolitanus TaxID=2943436 RepID=UPI002445CCD3|nr:uncharacterized protein LOC129601659 [Paramacrobiotus metropolitanus]